MQYALVFLEGVITFVSPCLLPMLPIYVSYFMGGETEAPRRRVLARALAFVLGFTSLFVLLGAFAGTLGGFFARHSTAVNLAGGALIVGLGLGYLGLLPVSLFRGVSGGRHGGGFWGAVLMGVAFSVGWTPCVGAFLGSALVLASQSGSTLSGVWMLLLYSLGLGAPFVLCALLLEELKGVLGFLREHGEAITRFSGGALVLLGALMMSGYLGKLLVLLS